MEEGKPRPNQFCAEELCLCYNSSKCTSTGEVGGKGKGYAQDVNPKTPLNACMSNNNNNMLKLTPCIGGEADTLKLAPHETVRVKGENTPTHPLALCREGRGDLSQNITMQRPQGEGNRGRMLSVRVLQPTLIYCW